MVPTRGVFHMQVDHLPDRNFGEKAPSRRHILDLLPPSAKFHRPNSSPAKERIYRKTFPNVEVRAMRATYSETGWNFACASTDSTPFPKS